MTNISRHRYFALKLLTLLALSPAQVEAQVNPDLARSLPQADQFVLIDVKRVMSEAVPRLLADEPALRPLVVRLDDLKALIKLDPLTVEHLAIALRFIDSPKMSGFNMVAIAQTSEAARLSSMIRQAESTKFVEQQYGGKTLFIKQPAKAEAQVESTDKSGVRVNEFAVAALNENAILFGDVAEVRAAIDVNAGKAKGVDPDQLAALKRGPKTLISVASLLPPSMSEAAKEFNPQLSETLSSIKQLYVSVELSSAGFDVAVTAPTASPEQAKHLADLLGAFKTLSSNFLGTKSTQDKMLSDLVNGLLISNEGNELQIRTVVKQATVNTFAKLSASEIYVMEGMGQIEKDDPKGAIAEFDKAILLIPDSANGFLNRGKANSDNANLDAAIADYSKAIALAPDWAMAYNNRGFVRIRKEEFDAAIEDLDKAITLDPTLGYAYNNRGQAFSEKGDFEKALADYDKSIALDAENPFAFANRGYGHIIKGELDRAFADFDRAISLNPKLAKAYNGRGLVRYSRYHDTGSDQELNQAIDDYNQGINLGYENFLAYSNRGYALVHKEEYDRAIADFDKSLALNPKSASAYNGRGLARDSKGEFDLAIADYEKAIALDPKRPEYYGNRALALLALRLDAQAAQDIKKCYELDQSMREVYEPLIKEVKKTRRSKPRRSQ